MAALRSSEEVFNHLKAQVPRDGDGDVNAIALFAFSLVEQERFQWKEHFREFQNREPTPDEIDQWFLNKPPAYFEKIMDEAFAWYDSFARALLKEDIEEEKRAAVAASVSTEVKKLDAFWPLFWRHNLFGVSSNILFILLLIVVFVILGNDVSIPGWIHKTFGSKP